MSKEFGKALTEGLIFIALLIIVVAIWITFDKQ